MTGTHSPWVASGHVHGGRIHEHDDPYGWLDFSANINPYGPPAFALRAARKALGHVQVYPDQESRHLRRTLASWSGHGPGEEGVAVAGGASDLLLPLVLAFRPKRLLLPLPTFGEYAAVASLAGVPVAGHPLVPEDSFAYRADELAERVCPGDLVVLCQPNNPTGRGWSEEETERVLQACLDRKARLLLDECFLHLSWPPLATLAASRRDAWPEEVLLLRAFTKDFAVPGLRVGYLLGGRRAVAAVRAFQQSWPVNAVGEAFALACMEEGNVWLARTRKRIASERTFLSAELAERGFFVFPGAANFLLARLPRNDAGQVVLPGSEVQRRLLPFRILLRTCTSFPGLGDDYVRLAVRRREENRRLCAALDEVFEGVCRRG